MPAIDLLDLVRQAENVMDYYVQHADGAEDLQCARGCYYCCHQFVAATAAEVFLLAGRLKAQGRHHWARGRIRGFHHRMGDVRDRKEWHAKQLPCPFLINHECSIYSQRPLACRGLFSFDRKRCEETAADTGARVKYWREPMDQVADLQVRLGFAIDKAYGPRAVPICLFTGLELVLGDVEGYAQKFEDGEDLFAAARERALIMVFDDEPDKLAQIRERIDANAAAQDQIQAGQ